MPRRIEKKTWPEMFEEVLSGKKTFDLRLADFDIKEGDILILREWNPKTNQYTGRALEKKVTYVLATKDLVFWDKKEIKKHGFLVMALENSQQ